MCIVEIIANWTVSVCNKAQNALHFEKHQTHLGSHCHLQTLCDFALELSAGPQRLMYPSLLLVWPNPMPLDWRRRLFLVSSLVGFFGGFFCLFFKFIFYLFIYFGYGLCPAFCCLYITTLMRNSQSSLLM